MKQKQSVTITGFDLNVTVSNPMPADAPAARRSPSKAEQRIAALRAAGIDTSMYFPLGTDRVVKIEDGVAIPVDTGDPTEGRIVQGGYVNHYRLFRRWVMAQMFRILRRMEQTGESFNSILQSHGYDYQWRMLADELHAQDKMFRHADRKNYEARSRWFSADTAASMADDYVRALDRYVREKLLWRTNAHGQQVPKHRCKGVHYVRFAGRDVFVSDLQSKVFRPLSDATDDMRRAATPGELLAAVRRFDKLRQGLPSHFKHAPAFIDAYKGSGAYFTMRNLILFHGARFAACPSETASLSNLESKTAEYAHGEGWRLIGVMKQLIADSHISVEAKIQEWQED